MNQSYSAQSHDRHIHPYAIGLGLASVISGGVMLAAPRRSGGLFALPMSQTLLRLIAARDLLLGGALLLPASRRVGLALRSLADAGDTALIASEVARHRGKALRGIIGLMSAGLSAVTAMRLIFREARLPIAAAE